MTFPVSQPLGFCPRCCSQTYPEDPPCGTTGTKLTKASEGRCLVGCTGPSCRGRRNQKKGKRGEYNRHRRLGGTKRFTPQDEMGEVYSIEIVTQDKVGRQIPASLRAFVDSEWARKAWSQAQRSIPEGVQAHESIYVEIPHRGWFLITRGGAR